jgi:sulfite exporter TauE/SafE/copper chaperone CopZ
VLRELSVDGMTCRACEIRVQRALRRVPGVEAVRADAATGRVRVTTSAPVSRAALAAAVARAGEDYRLGSGGQRAWLTRDRTVWRDLALGVAVVALLALALRATGLTSLADDVGAGADSASLGVVVMLGVAAGFSTCMALVGGLVLAFSARAADAGGATSTRERWRPQLAFNVGRIAGFAALGAATGLLGTAVTLSGPSLAVAMLVVAAVMTAAAVQLSGASPRLSAGLLPVLPDAISARLEGAAARAGGRPGARGDGRPPMIRRDLTAAGVGAATYLLPCGFTQAVQLYALSTGSPGRGAAIMAAFALGTAPGLLAVGGVGASVRGAWAARFARLAAVAVLALAVVNAGGALGILVPGWGSSAQPTASAAVDPVPVVDGVQHVATTQVADGYAPSRAVVVAGVPVRWEVTSEALTCASWLWAPELGVPADTVLTPGTTSSFTFTLTELGTYTYSCGMGMYSGTFEVVAAPA